MSLHTYRNDQAQPVGIAMRADGHRTYIILGVGASIVLENDPTKARPFNPTTKNWLPYNVLTDLGTFSPTLAQCDDDGTWASQ